MMWCSKCHNPVQKCTCPDIIERLNQLAKSRHVAIHPRLVEDVYRNQEQQKKKEGDAPKMD